ncbi:GH92 family glycosyl hydrolase [Paraprevotella clara]|uniref:GH92 family glycosyl hydrolase n=1 Tax=Paraprevotella clara TaxID=454154 RepID=UPI003FED6435
MAALSVQARGGKRLSEYVNPFIGATTNTQMAKAEHGLGKTFPGVATPWGMTQVSPNTITGGDNGSGYSYEHTTIEGFALTQMSGIGWYGDFGNYLVMPTTGPLHTYRGEAERPEEGYRSRYDKESETARAGYYAVRLTDYDIRAELTATPHGGVMRFTYPENECSRIQIDLARRVGGTSVRQYVERVDDYAIRGWMRCTPDGGGWGNGGGKADYTVYFYTRFSKPLERYGVWSAEFPEGMGRKLENVTSPEFAEAVRRAKVTDRPDRMEGDHLGFYTEFPTREGEQVLMRTAISFVSLEGAEANFKAELKGKDFERYCEKAAALWDEALSKIKISGGTEDERTIFYTSLYHTMIDPRDYRDVTGEYVGGDRQVHKTDAFKKRTVFSGWDVFRSQFPLQNLINPEVVNDMINSFVTLAEENGTGVYERWEFLNAYSGCMLGNPAIAVIVDAYMKGIRGYDVEKAYRFARQTADRIGHHPELGYSPGGSGISETLEYGYFDWCVGEWAEALDKTEDAGIYHRRGQAYRKIFDKEKGWFRVRNADGSWADWPEKGRLQEWYGCMECNPYQQGWFVPHDVSGMVEIMGGRDKVLADLESFFENTPREFYWNPYYNHANEPVHHVPFLFNRLGAPWLTQYWTRVICADAYKNSLAGLCGNEDVGQMSAWYILASAGFHPLCPGETRYELTAPVFDRVEIALDRRYAKGRKFVVTTGGRDKVLADLESFFENTPREFYWNPYYNHANEPVHHVPFLFNRLGAPWLTQYWTRVICADAYKNSLAGLCGNEDVGQMSAWYILASAGFHPLCPGETRYELTAPVFDRVEIALDRRYAKGRKFVVTTEGNAPDACYIQSATLNGKPYNRCYIDHEDIVRGGELHFVLGRTPNKQWGVE